VSPTILKVLVFGFLSVTVHLFVFVSEQKWREQSEAAKDEAAKLPHGSGASARRSVANIVKAYAERAGFDASTFSGHSLRAGFLTSAAGKGASIFKMMDVSRHKSVETLRGYVRDAELFKDHAGAGLL
jgi:site-specific recombinase XerD